MIMFHAFAKFTAILAKISVNVGNEKILAATCEFVFKLLRMVIYSGIMLNTTIMPMYT